MKTLIRWAARLYPEAWRERYAAEFDALLEDMSPSFGDFWDVVRDVVRARAGTPAQALLAPATGPSEIFRGPVVVSFAAHILLIGIVLVAAFHYVTPLPPHISVAPLPPPAPNPPPVVTDARVFPNASTLFSSLPLGPAENQALPVYVAEGVGIKFMALPDIGAVYRNGDVEWRVWPGQALEGFIVRRVLPEYPRNTKRQGAVSVFVEYLIRQDGTVKVLRSSGPEPFTSPARRAVEQWRYRPLEYEDRRCEVVSRVEVRFDSEFVQDKNR